MVQTSHELILCCGVLVEDLLEFSARLRLLVEEELVAVDDVGDEVEKQELRFGENQELKVGGHDSAVEAVPVSSDLSPEGEFLTEFSGCLDMFLKLKDIT